MKIDEMFVPLTINGDKQLPWKPIQDLMAEPKFPNHLQAAKKMGFRLLTKRAAIGRSKHVRVRPQFDQWSLKFTASVWDEQLSEDILSTIWTYSGRYKGLCDWRPGSKTPGPYGMFKLLSMVEVEMAEAA